MAPFPPPDECANCGKPIPRNALACPECGADERTGWRETSVYDGLDLPGEDADTSQETKGRPVQVFRIVVIVGVLIILVLGALGLRL